jgi:arginine deiminase
MTARARQTTGAVVDQHIAPRVGDERFYVGSEVGTLRRVLLHRPGLELRRLTPTTAADLLFDDVLWVERAEREHDAFAQALTERGIQVLYLHDLLVETLDRDGVRQEIAAELNPAMLGPRLAPPVTEWLMSLPSQDLAERLIGGITFDELPFGSNGLVTSMHRGFVLAPLPNHYFTRDTSEWIYGGVSINSMAKPARQREAIHLRAIYQHHPMFAEGVFQTWSDSMSAPVFTEGGDVLVIGNGAILIGMGERTRPATVEMLAERLFADGAAREVIAVEMPEARSNMHLDTVMTMVDRDAFTIYPELRAALRPYRLRPGRDGLSIEHQDDLFATIARALDVPSLRLFETGGDAFEEEREQWDDGNNVLAISPGVVVGYDRNVATNARLAEGGITVIEIEGEELGRGRGGPRCMSCPIERDGLPGQD